MDHSKLLFKDLIPKEIQDLIGEFNSEHRDKMKETLYNIHGILYNCFICDIYIIPHIHRKAALMRKRTLVCSKHCEIIATEVLIGVP